MNCKNCSWLNCISKKTLSSPWYWNIRSRVIFYGSSVWWDWTSRVVPFASGSGRFLDKIFEYAWVKKDEIYISNIVKCRLPNLRSPKESELQNCKNYVLEEIQIINPEIIVPMWNIATKVLLQSKVKLEDLVYKEFEFNWKKIIPMYHPAYMMRWLWDKQKYFDKMSELLRFAAN